MRQKNKFLKVIPLIILVSALVSIYQLPIISATTVELPVPYHAQEKGYYCYPASLEMVFDYWGIDIDQYEIADAARTDGTFPNPYGTWTDATTRAGHFSDMSTSNGEASTHVTGYTGRGLGYATFKSNAGISLSQLEDLLDAGYPVIVLQYGEDPQSSSNYGHFRVVIGYNDVTQMVKVHDPASWLLGPNVWLSYSLFEDYWAFAFTENKAYLSAPWDVSVTSPATVSSGDTFTVTLDASYPRPAPFTGFTTASSCEATITLPAGLSLAPGETNPKTLGTGSMTAGGSSESVSWNVVASAAGAYSISGTAEGQVDGSVSGHTAGDFPTGFSYTDRIGGVDSASVTVTGVVALQPPVASFTESAHNVPEGTTIDFNAITSNDPDGTIVLYEWDFDGDSTYDFSSASSYLASYTYTVAGTYTVTLRVTDNDGLTDTATDIKTVYEEVQTGPTIESAKFTSPSSWSIWDTFNLGDDVCVVGTGYTPDSSIEVQVVNDVTWSDGMSIPSFIAKATVATDAFGDVSDAYVVWSGAAPGKYDIVVDVNGNGVYNVGVDAIDDFDVSTAGFFVIPEMPLGTIMALISMLASIVIYSRRV